MQPDASQPFLTLHTPSQIALGATHPSFAEAVSSLADVCEATGREFEYEQVFRYDRLLSVTISYYQPPRRRLRGHGA